MMKTWLGRLMLMVLGSYSSLAQALYVSDDVFVVEADKPYISRQFYNDSKSTNMYLINMYQIDRPGKTETARPIPDGEVMYSPLQMLVNAGQFEYFKIFYRGPSDDQERYYRMVIREVPLSAIKDEAAVKDSMVSTIVALDTYAVVRPRQQKFEYAYDERAGTLKNTGNTFFRVLINRGCNTSDDDQAVVFDLLPQDTVEHELLRGNNQKYIVAFGNFKRLGTQCFDEASVGK